MIMPFLSSLFRDVADTLKRFPLAVCCAVAFTAIMLVMGNSPIIIDLKYWFNGSRYYTYLLISLIGCFWFISAQLIAESRGWSRWKFLALALPVFVIIILYVDRAASTTNAYLGTAIFLLMFVAPFLKQQEDSDHIWTFQYRIWLRLVFVVAASTILYLGVAVSLLSIHGLFGIHFYSRIYFDLAIIAVLFGSILAMAGIPKSFTEKEENCPKGLRVILCNIVIPLLTVYAVILYGYAAKILLMGALPKGGVVYMVMAFALLGVISYLAIYPLYLQRERKYWFGRYFFVALIVPICLLAVAIVVRISEYGITEDRYTVMISLLWFVSLIFLSFKKDNKMMKPAYLSLIVLLFAGSFGPWNVNNLSTASQVKHLEKLLTKYHKLSDNQIVVSTDPVNFEDGKTISSIVEYLLKNKKVEKIKPWFAGQSDKISALPASRLNSRLIMKEMGVEHVPKWVKELETQKAFSYRSEVKNATDIKEYDYFVTGFSAHTSEVFVLVTKNSTMKFSAFLDRKTNIYSVKNQDTQQSVSFNLKDIANKLYTQRAEYKKSSLGDPVVMGENNELKVKLIIHHMSGRFENEVPVIGGLMTLSLAIKVKK